MIAKMTPIEWLCSQIYTIQVELEAGNDCLKMKIEKAKQMEKLKNHSEYMRGWYNGFNSQEIEISNMEKDYVNEKFKSI